MIDGVKTERSVAVVSLSGEAAARSPRNGAFDTTSCLTLPAGHSLDQLSARRAAADLARRANAEWMIALAPGETLADDAFELAAPGLDLYDAIFGSAHVRGSSDAVARLTRLAFDSADLLPHALLNWWMPAGHLVRTETAQKTLEHIAAKGTSHWRLDYLFDIWAGARCQKSAQPLLELDFEPEPLGAAQKDEVLRRLAEKPVFLPIIHGDAVYHLPYTGQNAGIEREQTRGLFFEAMELEELRKVVRPGARIIDVGANTGNHTIFFAGPMKAASVMPFEPLPAAADALRASVLRNGLKNVDLSHLGIGIAGEAGRARFVFSTRGGLGATSLEPDPAGEIVVETIDSVISGPVDFLKVDVEGMEMSVLAGSQRLIAQSRPLIFIEIANRNTMAFCDWLNTAGYEVARIFTDKGHANYLIAPKGVL
jgi:FkbM family methyltransferase